MTKTLVEELREDIGDGAVVLLVGGGHRYDPLRLKAADEIEQLRLAEIQRDHWLQIAREKDGEIARRDQQLKESVDHEVDYQRQIERLRSLLGEKRTWCDAPLPGRPYPEYACGKCWSCRVRAELIGPAHEPATLATNAINELGQNNEGQQASHSHEPSEPPCTCVKPFDTKPGPHHSLNCARHTEKSNPAPAWDCACNKPDCAYCGPRLAQRTGESNDDS